jgi:FtsP/CotA-like multicopper oxidase with cupredoxin domain
MIPPTVFQREGPMVQDHNCKCFGQQLTPVIRAAAVAAAVGALWHVLGASAQEPQKADSPDASASAMAADEAPFEPEAKPITGLLADGVGYQYWTYNGTVPGPMIQASFSSRP